MRASAFVETTRIAVSDGENTMFIKSGLDFGTACAIRDGIDHASGGNGGTHSQLLVVLECMILGWEGPAFEDASGKAVPCTPDTIRQLDATFPLLERTNTRIAELMTARQETSDPNPTTAGVPSMTARQPSRHAGRST